MKLPFDELIGLFAASEPEAMRIWRHYPHVSEADDERSDSVDCAVMSDRFAAFARQHGYTDARVIEMTDAPDASLHRVVEVEPGTFVDWTARQFHNLAEPVIDVDALPFPYVWEGEALDHPAGFVNADVFDPELLTRRQAAFVALMKQHGEEPTSYDEGEEEDPREYHAGQRMCARYVAVTVNFTSRGYAKVFFLPKYDDPYVARSRATEFIADDIFEEFPVEVVDLDTGRSWTPAWQGLPWRLTPAPEQAKVSS